MQQLLQGKEESEKVHSMRPNGVLFKAVSTTALEKSASRGMQHVGAAIAAKAYADIAAGV